MISSNTSGNVGIGTISPTQKLQVNNGSFELSDGDDGFIFNPRNNTGYDLLAIVPKTSGSYD